MLRLLSITNFATIERLEIELAPGFSVLTGETGAGKSIIVDALGLLLGGRSDVGMVRSGASQSQGRGGSSWSAATSLRESASLWMSTELTSAKRR